MNILAFSTDDFLPPAGGAETAFWEVARRNPQNTYTLITARLEKRRPKVQVADDITVYRVGLGVPKADGVVLALRGASLARRLHHERPFDLAWSVMASYGAFAAVRFCRAVHVPFLLTLQEGKPLRGIIRRTPAYRDIFKSANGLHAISRYLKDWAGQMGFPSDRPARIIPNGVDVERFTEAVPSEVRGAERSRYGWDDDAYVVVTTSRLVPKNGIAHLIAALARLPERFKLVIHGYGPLEGALKRLAGRLGVVDRIRFMGHLHRERLPIALASADLFVRPSLSEGLGTSFLEAMAVGLPVVGTPVGGIVDFLRDRENGFLARPGDPGDIARVIAVVADQDPAVLDAIRERAVQTVRQSYEWDEIARRMDTFMRTLCV